MAHGARLRGGRRGLPREGARREASGGERVLKNWRLIAFATAIALGALWAWQFLAPPSLHIPPGHGQRSPNSAYAQGGAGCEPQRLQVLRGARGLRERERCADNTEEHRQQLEGVAQAARGARAAEQGAIEAYFQVRAVAFQCLLLILAFGAALWAAWEARKGAKAISEQVTLANKDFEATHRPWIAVRNATLRSPGIHIGIFSIELDIEYAIENTSSVPAIDVLATGVITPRAMEFDIGQMQRQLIETYKEMNRVAATPQEQIVFPSEKTDYRINVEMTWWNVEEKTEVSPIDLSDLLVTVVFIYFDPGERCIMRETRCTHRVTSVIGDEDVNAARHGTGVLKDGHIGKWRMGWSAT